MIIENGIPRGWELCVLPDFTDVVMGQSPPSSTYNTEKIGLPFFQGKAEFGDIHPEPTKYCDSPKKIANAGATLLSVRAPVGPTNLAKEKCCIGRGLAAIHPLDDISSMFILYLMRSLEPDISKEGTGSTFSAINKKFVENLKIKLPPLNEQKRIVAKIEALFAELDAGVASLELAQAQLQTYRQALLKHAFEGKLTAQWRTANADKLEDAATLLQRIQDERQARYEAETAVWKEAVKTWEANSKPGKKPTKPSPPKDLPPLTPTDLADLPQLPAGWAWLKLSLLAANIQIGPFGSLLHREDYITGGTPLVNPSHIKDLKIVPDWNLTVGENKLNELLNYRLQTNDIVMGRRGEMGRCAVVRANEDGWLCGTGSLFIRLIPSLTPDFYCLILSSQRVKEFLSSESIGTTMQNLNQKILHNVPVPVCSHAEQQEVFSQLEKQQSIVAQLEQTITEALQQAEALRQSILKKAFAGQLVPQDPSDEPASALLARIRAAKS